MSYIGRTSCVTCAASNSMGSSLECQHYTKARIKCGEFPALGPRILGSNYVVNGAQSQTSTTTPYIEHPDLNTLRPTEKISPIPAVHNESDLGQPIGAHPPRQHTNIHRGYPSTPHEQIAPAERLPTPPGHFPVSSTGQIVFSAGQEPIPPMEGSVDKIMPPPPKLRQMVVPSQAHLSTLAWNLTQFEQILPLTPESPGLRLNVVGTLPSWGKQSLGTGRSTRQIPTTEREASFSLRSQAGRAGKWPAAYLNSELETNDSENFEAQLLVELVPDRRVESNMIPFVIHSFAASMTRFTFEPTRIIPLLRDYIIYGYSLGHESRQTMLLISNIALVVSGSTDYDLTDFMTLQKKLVERVMEARAQDGLTQGMAMAAFEYSHEYLSTLWKVGSLANVLGALDLYAPIFRRACPESGNELVNLPRRLIAREASLKYYATLDVLQSVITHRPMFFRYALDFLSPAEETLLKSDNRPSMKWLYGIPDWLVIVLARINTLLEDSGSGVDLETVQHIERDIVDYAPIVATSPGIDPALNIGRIMVQESWRMAAYVYLYMGLCGADSADTRVVKIQKNFLRLLRGIKPGRNPDTFLILPIVIRQLPLQAKPHSYLASGGFQNAAGPERSGMI